MEIWEVVGVDLQAEFRSERDGRSIKGVRWFLIGEAPAEGDRYRGKIIREQFVSTERLNKLGVAPLPGQTVVFHFDRSGLCKVEVS